MLLDLKTACRELWKNRWFTCVVVLTLALGIGANTALFAVVNRVLLNPMPYPDADRLVHLRMGSERLPFTVSVPSLVAQTWREQARSFDGIEGYELRDVLAYDSQGARVLHGIRITPGLPAFLAESPLLGRPVLRRLSRSSCARPEIPPTSSLPCALRFELSIPRSRLRIYCAPTPRSQTASTARASTWRS